MESMNSEIVNANDINSSQISLFKSEFLDKIPLSNNLKLENISEDKCPICLAEMKDPTALSDCIHMFCFNCIQEWLNMKPECPLCKQSPIHLKHLFSNQIEKPNYFSPGIEYFLIILFL